MGRDQDNGAGGWTPLDEKAGMPEAEHIRLAPLQEELEEWETRIAQTRAMRNGRENEETEIMEFCVKRLRGRIWQALEEITEATPQVLARQLDVSDQTIRNWCNDDEIPVQHRRKGTRYYVDVRSAREYAASV